MKKTLDNYSGELLAEIDLEMFSKETLIDLMNLYGRLWLATDGLWYLTVKQKLGNEEALACDLLSPWFRNLEHKLEIKTRNHILLTVVNCPTLIALEKEGEKREDSICNLVEPRIFKGYASFFNDKIRVRCLEAPPRSKRSKVCCRWEFKLVDGRAEAWQP